MASYSSDVEELTLSDEIEEESETEQEENNNNVEAIQDVPDQRILKICNKEGKVEKLPSPKKVAITDERQPKSGKKRGPRGLVNHHLFSIFRIQNELYVK